MWGLAGEMAHFQPIPCRQTSIWTVIALRDICFQWSLNLSKKPFFWQAKFMLAYTIMPPPACFSSKVYLNETGQLEKWLWHDLVWLVQSFHKSKSWGLLMTQPPRTYTDNIRLQLYPLLSWIKSSVITCRTTHPSINIIPLYTLLNFKGIDKQCWM